VLLDHAFADDEILTWPYFGEGGVQRCIDMFAILAVEFSRAGLLWEVPNARGVAMWVSPDAFDRWIEAELATREPIVALTPDGGARYHAMWDWIEECLPDEPQWILVHIAVDEAARGTGIGSALIRVRAGARGIRRRPGDTRDLEAGEPGDLRAPQVPPVSRGRCARRRPAYLVRARGSADVGVSC
jgi:GNAT superfamily N-acetyltransferase